MENKSCSFVVFFIDLVCAAMWGLHVDYIIRLQGPESYVTPHFEHLDPRNVMVPLMMLSVSCNANASTNGFT